MRILVAIHRGVRWVWGREQRKGDARRRGANESTGESKYNVIIDSDMSWRLNYIIGQSVAHIQTIRGDRWRDFTVPVS